MKMIVAIKQYLVRFWYLYCLKLQSCKMKKHRLINDWLRVSKVSWKFRIQCLILLLKRSYIFHYMICVFFLFFFFFSLLVTVPGRTAKKLFNQCFIISYQESVWPRSDSFLGHTKMSFRKYCSTSCYSRRVWHMPRLIHRNQHLQHPKK